MAWAIPTVIFVPFSLGVTGLCFYLLEELVPRHRHAALAEMAWVHVGLGIVTFIALTCVTSAPFGKLSEKGWARLTVQPRASWMLQELPTLLAVVYRLYPAQVAHEYRVSDYLRWSNVLGFMFVAHYLQRCFVYPLTIKSKNPVPLSISLAANVYCSFNGWLQSGLVSPVGPRDAPEVPLTALVGIALFVFGMSMNIVHDRMLAQLRSSGKCPSGGYVIPRGWGFELVSTPNLAAEMLEWIGYAVTGVALEGTGVAPLGAGIVTSSFALYVLANLVPRAFAQHQWYRKTFPQEYPKLRRRALIPGLI